MRERVVAEVRGVLEGDVTTIGAGTRPGRSDFGRDKHLVLDAYRPARMPTSGDWLLVLEAARAAIRRKGSATWLAAASCRNHELGRRMGARADEPRRGTEDGDGWTRSF